MHQSPVIANLDGSSDGTMEVIIKSHQTSDIFILDHNGNELRRLNPNANITSRKDYNYPLAELNKRIFKSANRFVVNVVYILKDCKCTYFP